MSLSYSPPDSDWPDDAQVSAGDFWGVIDLNDFRNAIRQGNSTVTYHRAVRALRRAIIDVGDELSAWRASQAEAGFDTLAEVPSETIDGETRLQILWKDAVFATAGALLIESHRDVSATSEGRAQVENTLPTAETYRRDATHAIRAIKGEGRTTVDLI